MKFKVVSVSVNLLTEPPSFSPSRTEVVDTDGSAIFSACSSLRDVESAYESFCNYRSSPNRIENPSMKIKVLSVEPA
ncbi:MAG: hypothetical protein JO171_01675 [Paludibacterium sp.]|uniref:hypothetical protein n=1 Tax=Paludibacterium sp. TaxID=1917523 RepID=UPI0025E8FB9C|nr:hypothetical protein [Paludibacterium sp.]MBV8045835.1 hypothetical protein [Paludibacterium sp.]